MERRGIEAAPIFNSMCGDYEPFMDRNVLNEPEFNYFQSTSTKNTSNLLSVNMKSIFSFLFIYCLSFISKSY